MVFGRRGGGSGVRFPPLHLFPKQRPAEFDDGFDFEKGRRHTAMQGGQHGVADQFGIKGQNGGQLIAATVELDAEKADKGNVMHQPRKGGVAAGFDDLNGFGASHSTPPAGRSSVKAPVPVATGRDSSSSVAVTRMKATDLVT